MSTHFRKVFKANDNNFLKVAKYYYFSYCISHFPWFHLERNDSERFELFLPGIFLQWLIHALIPFFLPMREKQILQFSTAWKWPVTQCKSQKVWRIIGKQDSNHSMGDAYMNSQKQTDALDLHGSVPGGVLEMSRELGMCPHKPRSYLQLISYSNKNSFLQESLIRETN